jgi:hypothetical protein
MKVTCVWLPQWCGYLAIAKEGKFEYSQLLKSNQDLPSFLEKARQNIENLK